MGSSKRVLNYEAPPMELSYDGALSHFSLHEELRRQRLSHHTDFPIAKTFNYRNMVKLGEMDKFLVHANARFLSFMEYTEFMFDLWNKEHNTGRKVYQSAKGISCLQLQAKLLKNMHIDLLCFLFMYLNDIRTWPKSSYQPIKVGDKYYILTIIDGFREKMNINVYKFMKLLCLNPSDIAYLEVTYSTRSQRRKDITIYKLFQMIHVLHIPPLLFLDHLFRLLKEEHVEETYEEYYQKLFASA